MQIAKKLCEQEGLTYINGYNDAAIIAGQGTAALEILEQVPGRIQGGNGLTLAHLRCPMWTRLWCPSAVVV